MQQYVQKFYNKNNNNNNTAVNSINKQILSLLKGYYYTK